MSIQKGYLGQLIPNEPVEIIGGGISGLFTAYFLKKANIPFTLFEKEPNLGGKIQTTRNELGCFEHSASAIYSSDLVFEVIKDLGLEPIRAKKNLKKYIWREGAQASFPLRWYELIKVIPRLFYKTPSQSNLEMTVADFFNPLLGEKITSEVLACALVGIYAEDVSNLHFRSIFPLEAMENETYLSFFKRYKNSKPKNKEKATSLNFDNGLSELVTALREFSKDHIKTGHTVDEVIGKNTIVATDATQAARLLENRLPRLSIELSKISYNHVSVFHSFSSFSIPFLEGAFGMVFKPTDSFRTTLGIIRNDQVFKGRVKDKSLSSYSFICRGDVSTSEIEHDLIEIEQEKVLEANIDSSSISWKRGIPVYNLTRFNAIQKSHEILEETPAGVAIIGNYIGGISLREILQNAKALVEDLSKVDS